MLTHTGTAIMVCSHMLLWLKASCDVSPQTLQSDSARRLVPVLCEGILDDGAHLCKLLAELGGDFGMVGVL